MVAAAQNVEITPAGHEPPLRTCVVTRAKLPPTALIRFVVDPDGRVVPDLGRRLPGRGIWVTAEKRSVTEAVSRNVFSKVLRRKVMADADLPQQIERLLARRLADALSLANKAGLVTTGFSRIDAAIAAGSVAALLHGSDSAEDGQRKLNRKFLAISKEAGQEPIILRELTVDELSLALGRLNVVHAALSAGGATTKFLNEANRIARYRSGTPALSGEDAAHEEPLEEGLRTGKV
jgi:hypothetical protein